MSRKNASPRALEGEEFVTSSPGAQLRVMLRSAGRRAGSWKIGCIFSASLLPSRSASKRHGGKRPTMVLSETRRLQLCWVVRGGIWCLRRPRRCIAFQVVQEFRRGSCAGYAHRERRAKEQFLQNRLSCRVQPHLRQAVHQLRYCPRSLLALATSKRIGLNDWGSDRHPVQGAEKRGHLS